MALDALTQVLHDQDSHITVRETRVVSGKTTSTKDSTGRHDGVEHVWHAPATLSGLPPARVSGKVEQKS